MILNFNSCLDGRPNPVMVRYATTVLLMCRQTYICLLRNVVFHNNSSAEDFLNLRWSNNKMTIYTFSFQKTSGWTIIYIHMCVYGKGVGLYLFLNFQKFSYFVFSVLLLWIHFRSCWMLSIHTHAATFRLTEMKEIESRLREANKMKMWRTKFQTVSCLIKC